MIVKVKGGLCPIFSYSGAGTEMWAAVELKGVAKQDQVYMRNRTSAAGGTSESTAVAFTSVGKGYVGYVGDKDLSEVTTKCIMTMLGLH